MRLFYVLVLLGALFGSVLLGQVAYTATIAAAMTPTDDPIKRLGWVEDANLFCGGAYLEPPFMYETHPLDRSLRPIDLASDEGTYHEHSASVLHGHVVLTDYAQQLRGDLAYLYRDPRTGKISKIHVIGHVVWREPNSLVLADVVYYYPQTKRKVLYDVIYRTVLMDHRVLGPVVTEQAQLDHPHFLSELNAWGTAKRFMTLSEKRFDLLDASFSTCPSRDPLWQLRAKELLLNKQTGRGVAKMATLAIKGVPVLVVPYISFALDKRRQTGFLQPTIGHVDRWGWYVATPFYWNMAPNYDLKLTPVFLFRQRNIMWRALGRYLTEYTKGEVKPAVLIDDRVFAAVKRQAQQQYGTSTDPTVQARLRDLLAASTTRTALSWHHTANWSDHWSGEINYHHVSDDNYVQDFGSVDKNDDNQLLQEGRISYQAHYWNVLGRLQAYQTLHPLEAMTFLNQYRRLPQMVVNVDYPMQLGIHYTLSSEGTQFTILNNPGEFTQPVVGWRLHAQPGISWPIALPYFSLIPRVQLAWSRYYLRHTDTARLERSVPIVDVASSIRFVRPLQWFGHAFQETLEPQLYYVYIPFRSQTQFPIFDTSVNMLSYDQLFTPNRFSSVDRIGDTHQLALGVNARLVDDFSGLEKARFAIGQIVYFANRRVTLCNDHTCQDNPDNPENKRRFSPLTATATYYVDPRWNASANVIWDALVKKVSNVAVNVQYQPTPQAVLNIGYSYIHNGEALVTQPGNRNNDLYLTDISFAWPITQHISAVGRMSHDWHLHHFQNLLYGIQYDNCCLSVRLVAGQTFTNLTPQNTYQYRSGNLSTACA